MASRSQLRSYSEQLVSGIALVFGLQLLRSFTALSTFVLHDVRRWPPLLLLVLMAAFLSSPGLAGPLARRLGRCGARNVIAAALILTRLTEQLVGRPELDVWLAGLGCSLLWILFSLLADPHGDTQHGGVTGLLLVAVVADSALLAALRTLDLSWQPIDLGLWLVLPLAAIGLAGVWRVARVQGPLPGDVGVLHLPVAFGAWLTLQMFAFQNLGSIGARTGLSLEAASVTMMTGNAIALIFVFGPGSRVLRRRPLIAAGGVLLSALVLPLGGAWSSLGFVLGTGSAAAALVSAFAGRAEYRPRRPLAALGAPYVFLLLLFSYYGTFRLGGTLARESMLMAAALILVLPSLSAEARSRLGDRDLTRVGNPVPIGVLIALLVLPPIGLFATRETTRPRLASTTSLRLATYNLHQGFDVRGRLGIEALARDIERSGADVVALQEVSRGWVVTGAFDMLAWLSRRLGMEAVWAPSADPQWGNAVLSRVPIGSRGHHPLPPRTLPMRRGFVEVTVDLDGKPVRVLATHLHHRSADEDVRIEQVSELIQHLRGQSHTVLMGDLNSRPDSSAISMLRAVGMVDAASDLPVAERATHFRSHGPQQIDYIWVTPDLMIDQPSTLYTAASDHALVAVSVGIRDAG